MSLPTALQPCTARRLLLSALVLCAACAGTRERGERDVGWLIDRREYEEAVALAEREVAAAPASPRAQERLSTARAALAMGQARRLIFEDRDEEAMELLLAAQELAPRSPEVRKWIANTSDKLAERYQQDAQILHMSDELEGAVEAYERALAYQPDHEEAALGLARVLLQINYRSGVGERYYREGVHALDAYQVAQARARFAYTLKYTPGNERAQDRHLEAGRMLASTRAAEAAKLEQAGRFAAARNEYRIALLHDRTQPDALAGMERTSREEQVAQALRIADAFLLRGRHEDAMAALEGLDEVTVQQKDALEAFRGQIVGSRLEDTYSIARSLEVDGLYEEAVETYERLLALTPFFRDAIARRDTLQSYIAEAARLYAQQDEAPTDDERARLLRRITVFWPQYRDVNQLLEALEPAGPQAAPVPAGDSTSSPG